MATTQNVGRQAAIASLVGLLALVFADLSAPPAGAQALETPTANCGPRISDLFAGAGPERFAQTFSPSITGDLTRAEIYVTKEGTPGDYVVQVMGANSAGLPDDSVLASATVPDSMASGPAILDVGFADPATVVEGQTYALVIARPASNTLTVGTRQDCPGRFHNSVGGGAWGAFTNLDFAFVAFVTPAPDSTPPVATIVEEPKNRTERKRATFEFSGGDARAVASFECAVDGESFRTCDSPFTVKVKRGRHTFRVRAIDEAGNIGSPARDRWRVTRKA